MTTPALEAAVRDRLGIEPSSLGTNAIARATASRMRATGVHSAEAYLTLLLSPAEANALANELSIPETWFFRGGRALFDRLAEFLIRRSARNPGKQARALSIPCSTGEEPYSLAIVLRERFAPPEGVHIDGVDVSAQNLDRAVTAQYPDSSFREAGADPRLVHFQPIADRWQLRPHLRTTVHFRQGNVTAATFLSNEAPYDLIICRNLFIYLTANGRKRAMTHLDRLLQSDGRLCLTAAEADRLPSGQFVHDGPHELCLFRRANAEAASGSFPAAHRPPKSAGSKSGVVNRSPSTQPPPRTPPAGPFPAAPIPSFERARELADAGHLSDARKACEQACADNPGSADGYALLGAILLSENNVLAAGNAFRKALYLAPDHQEALAHLIVLADRRGDHDQATAFRKRLARLAARGESS